MVIKTFITPEDVLSTVDYEKIRKERRKEITEKKRKRRLSVGPYATIYFECYDTMWYQVHEMLRIEKGGEKQVPQELEAYNTLIPKGQELVATLMFEIPDGEKRRLVLARLGGVEDSINIKFQHHNIRATAEGDVDRTNAAGKASAVHFIHFNFSLEQIDKIKNSNPTVIVEITHKNYNHSAIIPQDIKEEITTDLLV